MNEQEVKVKVRKSLEALSLPETAFAHLIALVGLYLPSEVISNLNQKVPPAATIESSCAEFRRAVTTSLSKAGVDETSELVKQFMTYSVYLEQARILGSNEASIKFY